MKYRNIFMGFIAFIMLLNGGMLPTYMVVRSLGILDTRWALLPGALSVINIIIMRSGIESVPG